MGITGNVIQSIRHGGKNDQRAFLVLLQFPHRSIMPLTDAGVGRQLLADISNGLPDRKCEPGRMIGDVLTNDQDGVEGLDFHHRWDV